MLIRIEVFTEYSKYSPDTKTHFKAIIAQCRSFSFFLLRVVCTSFTTSFFFLKMSVLSFVFILWSWDCVSTYQI